MPQPSPDDERFLRDEVLVLSRHTARGGGASRAAESMAKWYGCRHVTLERNPRTIALFGPLTALFSPLSRFQELLLGLVLVPFDLLAFALRPSLLRGVRLVHVHDTWTAFSPILLWWLSRRCSLVVTLHDCSLLTGGCVYPYSCDRYAVACGACPQRRARKRWWTRFDSTAFSLRLKRHFLRGARISWVSPSRWLADLASRGSVLQGVAVTVIPNAVDAAESADADGRSQGPLRVVYSATALDDRRKGADLALAVFNSLDFPLQIHLVGGGAEDFARAVRVPCVAHGFVEGRDPLFQILRAADVFFLPSRADNLPYGISEALAAGLPVVSTRVGGIPEMVDHGVNGLLCEPEDVEGMVSALRRVSVFSERSQFGMAARLSAGRYSVEVFVNAHLELYHKLRALSRPSSEPA